MPFIHTAGAELYYTAAGDGPTCVAVHGGPGMDGAHLRRHLAGLPVRLVVYDQRGHGRSTGQPESMDQLADDLAAVIGATCGGQAPVVLGHSFGSFVALVHALRRPVRALVLVGAAASHGFRDRASAIAGRRATAAQLSAYRRLWDGSLRDDSEFRAAWETLFPLYFHDPRRCPPALPELTFRLETRRRVLPLLAGYDVRAQLGAVAAPALVVTGRSDWITPPEEAFALAQGLPRAALHVPADSGHMPFWEEPGLFRLLLADFLERVA
jgi:proline iminopeptidase